MLLPVCPYYQLLPLPSLLKFIQAHRGNKERTALICAALIKRWALKTSLQGDKCQIRRDIKHSFDPR